MTFNKPEAANAVPALPEGVTIDDCKICCYDEFLLEKVPKGTPDRDETLKTMRSKFAAAGGPGAKFRVQQDKLFKQLLLPKGAREELGIVGDAMEPPGEDDHVDSDDDEEKQKARQAARHDKEMTYKLFGDGRYHICPSFFRCLMFLRKQKKEFAISFRTFGKDMDNVVFEFNKFCNGEHPCFNGRNGTPLVKMDGSKNSKDFRIKANEQYAKMYRGEYYHAGEQPDKGKLTMVSGKHERAKNLHELLNISSRDDTFDIDATSEPLEIYQNILETLKKHASIAIEEDYKSWDASGRDCSAGKPLHIDLSDYNTQHIFFDDNADEGRACIVDVRDVITQEEIPQSKFMNLHVVKVQPHRAILEGDYFVKQIEMCELARDEEIKMFESG